MSISSPKDLEALMRIGRIVGLTVREMRESVRPGMTTLELDAIGAAVFARFGARSAPRLVYNFPGDNCISVNDEAVHGIPGDRALRPGDVVKIDVTAELDGYMADAATTVALAPAAKRKQQLAACAESALQKAIAVARAGQPIYTIGRAVEAEVTRRGFHVIPELCGHGVGRTIHEEPRFIPNYEDRRYNERLTDGMVITIEPIIAAGAGHITQDADGWTLRTIDGSPAAHAEHTIVVTKDRPIVLTAV
jgi:methionyl aminopeptidase